MKQVMTTGEVCRLLEVAPRTVSGWCDSGILPSYRLPGSFHRRIQRDTLIEFLTKNSIPVPKELLAKEEEPCDTPSKTAKGEKSSRKPTARPAPRK